MQTKLIKITRTVTLTSHVTAEVPADLNPAGVESALRDDCNLTDHMIPELDNDDEKMEIRWDVDAATKAAMIHVAWIDPEFQQALKDDELLNEDLTVVDPQGA